MTTHIMVDLETWGTTPGSDIRSIGAVVFDPIAGTLGDEFYVNVENPAGRWRNGEFEPGLAQGDEDYRLYPLTRDPATVEWWSKQSESAQAALRSDVRFLKDGLVRFSNWWQATPCAPGDYVRFWAHGPHFDEQILAACYRAVEQPIPWHYRSPRDVRTVLEAAGLDPKSGIPSFGTEHNALDDAKAQALGVCAAYRLLGVGNDRIESLLGYNNDQVEKRRAATALLREAAALFRSYEAGHQKQADNHAETIRWREERSMFLDDNVSTERQRADRQEKADRNRIIAERIETFLQEIHQ